MTIVARKTLFEKHAHEEDDDEEEYGVDDLNLEGDAGAWCQDMLSSNRLLTDSFFKMLMCGTLIRNTWSSWLRR